MQRNSRIVALSRRNIHAPPFVLNPAPVLILLHNHWTELSTAVLQTLFPRSGDVIHPQLWESGSGYETIECADTAWGRLWYDLSIASNRHKTIHIRLCDAEKSQVHFPMVPQAPQ